MNFYLSKFISIFGFAGLLNLGTFQAAVFADAPVSSGVPTTDSTPASTPADAQPVSAEPVPDNSVTPNTSQAPYTPLIPQQQANPYAPYPTSAITTSGAQSPQIISPSLYTTGTNDLSLVSTNNALTQAFSQEGSSDIMSDQALAYSHPPIERLRLGPFDLKAALVTNVTYDDNLRTSEQLQGTSGSTQPSQGKTSDTSFAVTPAVLLEYGTHEGQRGYASLVYSPTITRFFHESNQDSEDQNVALNVLYPFQRLTLNFSESFSQTTGVNQDLNARTTQNSSATIVGGSYDIDDKLNFSANVQEVVTSFSGGGDQGGAQGVGDQVSSVNTSLSYHLSDKITLGPSLNAGIDKPDNAKEETFEQGLLGLTYQPTQKISLFAQAGIEFRQGGGSELGAPGSQNVQNGDETNPIFGVGANYNPFDSTSLSVGASQSVHSSAATAGDNVVSTNVSCTATQRFFQRLFLTLSYNYTHSDDSSGTDGISTPTGGSEDTFAYRTSLSISPTAWTSVAVYYQYLDNESNEQGNSYHDNQMGVSASVQF